MITFVLKYISNTFKYKYISTILRLALVVASLSINLFSRSIVHAPHWARFQLSKPSISINLQVHTGSSSSSSANATSTADAHSIPLTPTTTPTPAILTWSPPPCGDPTHGCGDYYITESGQGHQFL